MGRSIPPWGAGLYDTEPVYREVVDACLAVLERQEGLDLRPLLFPDDAESAAAELERPSLGLPALLVVEIALARLWMSRGIRPAALIGHSMGEYAAAHLAGVMTLDDALALVTLRGRLFETLPAGRMLSVPLSETDLRPYLNDGLEVSVINAPALCVVSGREDAVDRLEARLEADGVDSTRIKVAVAAHSSLVEPILDAFAERARQIALRPPEIPLVSNVSGTWMTAEEATDPGYWTRHIRQTVRFADGVQTLLRDVEPVLLEVGPGRTLTALAALAAAVRPAAVTSLRHPLDEAPDDRVFVEAFGCLWTYGAAVDWSAVRKARGRRVHLPTYPFERERHWVDRVRPTTPVALPVDGALETLPNSNIAMASQPTRRVRVLAELRRVFAELSGLAEADLDSAASFLTLGFDSLALTQASQAVKKTFGIRVSFRDLLERVTSLDALADHLDAELPADAFAEAPQPVAAVPSAPVLVATPIPPAVPSAMPAMGAEAGAVERLVAQQLQLMQQQLDLLRGGSVASSPGATPAASAASSPASSEAPKEAEAPKALFKTVGAEAGDGLTPRQQAALDAIVARYNAKTATSKRMMQEGRFRHSDPRSAAGFRRLWKEAIYPLTADRSAGATIWDVDGNAYVDFNMGYGVNLFGHAPDFITEALQAQVADGLALGPMPTVANDVAERIARMTGHERVSFFNTGSEAMLAAIRAARTATGRTRIAMLDASYHGNFDEVLGRPRRVGEKLTTVPGVPGLSPGAVEDVLVLQYGEPETLATLRAHADDLAAVLVEPVQSRRPDFLPTEFLKELRAITEAAGAALVFDEMISGFRFHPGGVAGHVRRPARHRRLRQGRRRRDAHRRRGRERALPRQLRRRVLAVRRRLRPRGRPDVLRRDAPAAPPLDRGGPRAPRTAGRRGRPCRSG